MLDIRWMCGRSRRSGIIVIGTNPSQYPEVVFFLIPLLWLPLLSQSNVVIYKSVKSGREKKTELGTLATNVEHQSRSTRSITPVTPVKVTLVPGLVGRQSAGRNKSRCLGLLMSSVSLPPRMRSCMGKEHEQSH